MRKNNSFIIYLLMIVLCNLSILQGRAQDMMPAPTRPDVRIKSVKQLNVYKLTPDTIAVRILFPEAFQNTQPNVIIDQSRVLKPVMEQLLRLKSGASEDTLRILHIGDSHIRGRIYPRTVGTKLNELFNFISYTDMGVNGATCLTFTHPDRIASIAEYKPDLLVLSFGTNESHNKRYNSTVHYHQMDELVKLLRANMPGVPILLTTPPGSYESFRQKRRRRTYAINPRTITAVNTIRKYGQDHKIAVWDIYSVAGGKDYAAKNWWDAGLMRPDHVHYIAEGYILQGELLFEALINTYNEYVSE